MSAFRRTDFLSAAAGFARRGALLPDAFRRLGGHLAAVVLLAAAAHALGRGAQPPADALGLRLLAFGLRVAFGFRARVELAADELDLRDLRAVALAEADAKQTGIAARPIREAGRERVEQLRHDVAILQIHHHDAARAEQAAV